MQNLIKEKPPFWGLFFLFLISPADIVSRFIIAVYGSIFAYVPFSAWGGVLVPLDIKTRCRAF
jgi:hypothetical protein